MATSPKFYSQGTIEWYTARWGKITMSDKIRVLMDGHAHELNKLLDFIKWQQKNSHPDTIRQEYEREMQVGDRVKSLSWGRSHEHDSVRHYEMIRMVKVRRPGFVTHPDYPLIGDSTDFIETDDGTIQGTPTYACEIKCPFDSANHKAHIRYGMPQQYYHQTQGHMEVHKLQEGKFVSYDPRHPIEQDKLYVQMLERDEAWAERFNERAKEFTRHFKRGSRFEHETGTVKDGIPTIF